MRKIFWLLLCIIVACKKEPAVTKLKQPDFFYLKTKKGFQKDSLNYYLQALEKVPKTQISDSLKAEFAYVASRFNDRLKQYDTAIEKLIYATSFSKDSIKNNREILFFRTLYAMYFTRKNDYLNAAGVNAKLFNLLSKNDYRNKAYVYNATQRIKMALNKTEEALTANKQAAAMFLKAKDTVNYLVTSLDKVAIYSSLGKHSAASKELQKIVPYERLLNTTLKYQLYNVQGYSYVQNKQYKKAVEPYKKALQYSKELTTRTAPEKVANNYLNLSITHLNLKEYTTAKKYIDSVFNGFTQHMSFIDLKEALKTDLEITYKQGKGIETTMPQLDSLLNYLAQNYDDRINNEMQVLQASFEKEKVLEQEKNIAEIKSLKFQRNQYILFVLLLIVIVLTILILNFYRQRKFSMEKQNFLLQQRLLRSQMNPHFIFNSLSLIKQNVEKNKAQYAKYIVKLSRLLRTVFDNSTKDYVPLEDELQSLEDYIELQQFRFPNRFTYEIENTISTDTELFIPPMLLQPFVENAIIHGFGKLETTGHLWVQLSYKKEYLVCIIDDTGVGIEQTTKNRQSSVYLIDQFLTKMTGKKIIITNKKEVSEASGTKVELKIPYTEL